MTAPSFRPPQKLPSGAAKSRGRSLEPGQIVAFAMLAVVAVLLVFVIATTSGADDATPYNPDNASEARAQCEDLVTTNLKAPASAEFGTIEATRSGGEWIVTGYVDAENSFGAMLRTDFQCTVRVTDGVIERRLDSIG